MACPTPHLLTAWRFITSAPAVNKNMSFYDERRDELEKHELRAELATIIDRPVIRENIIKRAKLKR